jgi:hypothetical protein
VAELERWVAEALVRQVVEMLVRWAEYLVQRAEGLVQWAELVQRAVEALVLWLVEREAELE